MKRKAVVFKNNSFPFTIGRIGRKGLYYNKQEARE